MIEDFWWEVWIRHHASWFRSGNLIKLPPQKSLRAALSRSGSPATGNSPIRLHNAPAEGVHHAFRPSESQFPKREMPHPPLKSPMRVDDLDPGYSVRVVGTGLSTGVVLKLKQALRNAPPGSVFSRADLPLPRRIAETIIAHLTSRRVR